MSSGEYPEELVELVTRALWARANGRRLRANEPSPGRGTMYWLEARSVLDALSSAGRLVPDLSGSGGQPAHHCPANGTRTLRARDLTQALDPGLLQGMDEADLSATREWATTEQATMRTHHLCEQCGYPLDRSTPHPDAMREPPADTGWAKTESVRDSERRRP